MSENNLKFKAKTFQHAKSGELRVLSEDEQAIRREQIDRTNDRWYEQNMPTAFEEDDYFRHNLRKLNQILSDHDDLRNFEEVDSDE